MSLLNVLQHPERMKIFLVVNPASANGTTGKRWLELEARMRRRLGDCTFEFTRRPEDAERLTREALRAGYPCVAALGGDGTINEVVNGFFENGNAVAPQASLVVVPRGTGGDFRRTFGWDLEVEAALERALSGRTQKIDVGLLEFTKHDGGRGSRYFANVCSLGVSGQVDQTVNQSSKWLGGKLTFMWGSTRALLSYSDKRVQYALDGGEWKDQRITALAVANGRYFGGGMCVAPGADPSDGWFDVTVWSGYGVSDFVFKSKAIYNGGHVNFPGTTQARCRRLEAKSDEEVLLDVDGEAPGRLPCAMSLLPSALQLKV